MVDGDVAFYAVPSDVLEFVVLANLQTAERKLVWGAKHAPGAVNDPRISATALALPYAYWQYGDAVMFRFDTRDGTLKSSGKVGACEIISGTSTGLGACASAGVGLVVVDFDKNAATLIAETGYTQANGMLSQDGKDAVWIDFRDPGPKGEHGTWDKPWGGEVYRKDLVTSVEERITSDTPGSPAMKTSPWAYKGNLAWVSLAGTPWPNPDSSTAWYSPGPVWVKRAGKAPVLATAPGQWIAYPRPVKPGILGGWLDKDKRAWLVLLKWPDEVDGGGG